MSNALRVILAARHTHSIHEQVEKSPFHIPWKGSIQVRHIMDCNKLKTHRPYGESHQLFRQDCGCQQPHLLYQHQSTDGFVVLVVYVFFPQGGWGGTNNVISSCISTQHHPQRLFRKENAPGYFRLLTFNILRSTQNAEDGRSAIFQNM